MENLRRRAVLDAAPVFFYGHFSDKRHILPVII
jgi:hypothetical protein